MWRYKLQACETVTRRFQSTWYRKDSMTRFRLRLRFRLPKRLRPRPHWVSLSHPLAVFGGLILKGEDGRGGEWKVRGREGEERRREEGGSSSFRKKKSRRLRVQEHRTDCLPCCVPRSTHSVHKTRTRKASKSQQVLQKCGVINHKPTKPFRVGQWRHLGGLGGGLRTPQGLWSVKVLHYL